MSHSIARSLFVAGMAVSVLSVLGSHPAAADGPFAGLAGRWVGGGKIVYTGGKTESLNCRVTYFVDGGGSAASQTIRCAGASTTFVVKGSFSANGGKVSGSWSETSRNVSGSISGRVNGGTVSVAIAGDNFSGSMAVNTNGGAQSVVIKPNGDAVDKISLSLRKG